MTQETTGKESAPVIVQLAKLARSEAAPEAFFRDFFRLVHSALAAEGGSIWLYDSAEKQLAPKVSHSPPSGPLKDLSEEIVTRIVYRTIEQKQPVLYYPEESETIEALKNVCLISVPVEIDEKLQAVVLLARGKRENAGYARDDVHTLQSLCVYLVVYFSNFQLRQTAAGAQRLGKFGEIESELAGTVELERMAFTLANRIREVMFFDRAFVALPTRTGFRIAAVSGVDDVPQKGAAVQNLRDLVREVARIGGDWHFTPEYLEKVEDELLREKLMVYFETSEYKSILLMRMEDDEGLLAVTGFERRAEGSYAPADFKFLQGVSKASAGALRRAKRVAGMPGISLVRRADSIKKSILGPARVKFALKAVLLLAAAALLAFGKWDLTVKGDCRIVPNVKAVASARYRGTIIDILKTEEDLVEKGEVIAVMDDREITSRISGKKMEIAEKERERNALLTENPAAAGILEIQLERLKTQLQLLNLERDGLKITSPIAGVIITPRDLINASLDSVRNAGDAICEIADISRLYLEVEVSERDVALVREGQEVDFALAGAPNITFTWRVDHVTPATRALPGKNVFIVRALPEDGRGDGSFRIYLTGSASISTGKRHVLYVLFRSTLERFRTLFL